MAPSGRRLCRLKCEELDNSVDTNSHQPQPSPEIQRLENGHEHQASMQWQWSWPIFVRKGLTKLHQCTSRYNKNIDWWLHASLPPHLVTVSAGVHNVPMSQHNCRSLFIGTNLPVGWPGPGPGWAGLLCHTSQSHILLQQPGH